MGHDVLSALGIEKLNSGTHAVEELSGGAGEVVSRSPIDLSELGRVTVSDNSQYAQVVEQSGATFLAWRMVPAPKRGELVREIAQELRSNKEALGRLITLECGKILSEGLGEVQEAIDIADFAVGLSRQLYGSSMHSERPLHRMYEQWHPLGPVGVITAFNFPMAVWAWNAMIAAVCGNTVIWKPSQLTPLCAVALNRICRKVAKRHGFPALFALVTDSSAEIGKAIADDVRIPLVSATGSCSMGRSVGERVASRFGRSILELGGNNAIIVLDDCDLDLATRAILFGSVGTAGQRCTSTRRVLVQSGIAETLIERLIAGYKQIKIGDPFQPGTLMGPLISEAAVKTFSAGVARIEEEGGKILYGGSKLDGMPSPLYVQPTLARSRREMTIVKEEIFAPILHLITVRDLSEAIEANNEVPQGLSSAIFTDSVRSAERFLSHLGSDCGIANVNIGTSGAEIGGAFGGEKATGGGREAGSDSWKAYMRRQTNTINWSPDLPLAQGISFL